MNTAPYIHIADDDRDDIDILVNILKLKFPRLILGVSRDGLDLLNDLRRSDKLPDLLFLDINMPNMNGFDVIAVLKADERLGSIKTAVYSTSGDIRDIEKMYVSGADFYLEKPKDIDTLLYLVDNLCYRAFEENYTKPDRGHFILN